MRRGVERALDECLSQLNTGELGLEEVLARHPEHETELRPLLRTAMLVRHTPRAVPSPAAKAAGRQRLLAAVAKKRREKVQARPGLMRRLGQSAAILVQPLVRPQRQPLRLAQAIAALLIIVSLISAGTVGVAASSLPDSPLYPIKRTTERVQLALTTSPASKARLYMSHSERRWEEIRALWETGKGLSEATLQDMNSARSDALTAISQVSGEERLSLLTAFDLLTEKQQKTLEEIRPAVPPSNQEAVEEALEASEDHRWVAKEAMVEPDLLLTPSPMPRPTDTATSVPPTFTPAPVPTATPVPPTPTAIPRPTVKPMATPTRQAEVPAKPPVELTATPTPEAEVPFVPTVEPTSTAQAEVPFVPTLEPTVEPTSTPQAEVPFVPTLEPTSTAQVEVPFVPAVEPTVEPTPTATPIPLPTATPTPLPTATSTPLPTATPTPLPPAKPTPTPQVEVPFQPVPASSVTNCRVSDAPGGAGMTEFPAGTGTVYIVFDYAYMAGEEVVIRVYDSSSNNVLFEESKNLSGDGTECITFSADGGLAAGRYAVNIYHGGSLIKTVIWEVAE
jgi:hypothetical protein